MCIRGGSEFGLEWWVCVEVNLDTLVGVVDFHRPSLNVYKPTDDQRVRMKMVTLNGTGHKQHMMV